jgi:hypothetical protein
MLNTFLDHSSMDHPYGYGTSVKEVPGNLEVPPHSENQYHTGTVTEKQGEEPHGPHQFLGIQEHQTAYSGKYTVSPGIS